MIKTFLSKGIEQIGFSVAIGSVLFVLFLSSASAQFRASIQGTVTDPEGKVVPGATLTLTDNDTSRVLNATSNASGVYNFNALPPNHFTLATVAAAGAIRYAKDPSEISQRGVSSSFAKTS